MKKKLIISLIALLAIAPNAFAIDDNAATQQFIESDDIYEYFYRPPVSEPAQKSESATTQRRTVYPLFKKVRIKMTNFYREKEYNRTQKFLEKQNLKSKNSNSQIDKLADEELTKFLVNEEQPELNNYEQTPVQLSGEVREQVTPKEAQLDADKIRFNSDTMDMIATGSPVLYFPPQKTKIKAKKMIYNHNSNILKAIDNVEIIRNGQKIHSDYLEINMNEETASADKIDSKISFLTVNAKKADMDEKTLTLYDGQIASKDSFILNLETSMVGGMQDIKRMVVPEEEQSHLLDMTGDVQVNVDADEVIVNAKKYNDTITLKKAKIRYGDFELFKIPSMTFHTNKNYDYVEANYPELGSRSRIGMFAGPGYVIDTPIQSGSSIKIIPIANYGDHKFGVGGFAKYHSATNHTDFGYVSSYNTPVLEGQQKLDDHLYLQYGMNSYMDEWFLGQRMSRYNAELIYKDEARVKSTLAENLNLRFRHRAGIGYMHNAQYNRSGEHIKTNNIGTMRARYMAELAQDLLKYENPEHDFYTRLSLIMQGSAAVYGTGDTQIIGRVGPSLDTQYKRWFQNVRYYVSAYEDNTPIRAYDAYRYGHGTLYIREALRVCKYLTVAWAGTLNVLQDAPGGKLFRENAFLVILGPDDFKFQLGYDWERERTFFALIVSMDTKGSALNYNKMIIKNPDRLANHESNQVELKVFDKPQNQIEQSNSKKRMMYAEVIDIESPSKEQI